MTTLEKRLFVGTNAVLLFGVVWCTIFFALDIAGVAPTEEVFSVGASLFTLGAIICVFLGWYATYQYFMRRAKIPASGADYILLLVAVFMPFLAIYVLRKIRRHATQA